MPLVGVLLGFGCLAVVVAGVVVAGGAIYFGQRNAGGGDAAGTALVSEAEGRQYLVVQAADDFRLLATNDYYQGLKKHAAEEATVRFFDIGDELWPFVDETLGWAYFFNSCVIAAPPPQGEWLPVGFYHPYSDVLLVTMWSVGEDAGPRMEDAELFMGDFIRRGGSAPLSAERPWMRIDAYRPAAMLQSANDTIDAFEQAFHGGSAQGSGWRDEVSGVAKASLVADNLTGAAMLLTKNFAELRAYNHEGRDDRALPDVRAQVKRFIENRGLVDMPDAPATRQIQLLPEEAWKSLRIVSYANSKTQRLVTLAVAATPDRFISLLFDVHGQIVTLKRVDLLSYAAFVAHSKASP